MGPFMIILLVIGLIILFSSFFTVKQQTAVVIERFGKFLNIFFGYLDRPTGSQLIAYLSTLGVLIVGLRIAKRM